MTYEEVETIAGKRRLPLASAGEDNLEVWRVRRIFDERTLRRGAEDEACTVGLVFTLSLAVFAYYAVTERFSEMNGPFGSVLAVFVICVCTLAVGSSLMWLRRIVRSRENMIRELQGESSRSHNPSHDQTSPSD
jgi:hypothetical protein